MNPARGLLDLADVRDIAHEDRQLIVASLSQFMLKFTFNGRRLSGFAGDTLASALLANGVRLTGRSFKYHRPRGIQGAGFAELREDMRRHQRRAWNPREDVIQAARLAGDGGWLWMQKDLMTVGRAELS